MWGLERLHTRAMWGPGNRRNDHRISFRFLKLIYVTSVPAFLILNVMREQVIQLVEQYIDAVRRNDGPGFTLAWVAAPLNRLFRSWL